MKKDVLHQKGVWISNALLKKIWRMMKLTGLFLLISFVAISAGTYSQNTRFSFKIENGTLNDLFLYLEQNSEFRFAYNKSDLDDTQKISVKFENESVEQILNKVLDTDKLSVSVKSEYVIITSKGNVLGKPFNTNINQSIRTVTGKVTDPSGIELPGVTVVVKKTPHGTITGADGTYSLTNVPVNATLVFSFVGMKTQEIVVTGKTTVNVIMTEDAIGIEEVVAVGYGVQKKVNLTGAVSSVNFENEALTSRSFSNISSALSGLASGLQVRQTNGLPSSNNEASINIRGIGSLNMSSAPLVVVDGQVAPIGSVDPNDVASISILKDAASAAIYGSQASNGVILITTKTGKDTQGKVTFEYNNYVGWKSPTMLTDYVTNTADHMTFGNMVLANSGLAPVFPQTLIDEWREKSKTDPIGYPNNNWWDVLIKRDITTHHSLSARGGGEKISFYTSVNYFKDDGIIPNTGFDRINFRNNLSYQVNKWIKLGNNIAYGMSKAEPASISNVFAWMRATSPGQLPKHPDGRYGGPQTGVEAYNNNPLLGAESARGKSTNNRFQGKVFGEFTPLKGLTVTSSYYIDVFQSFDWSGSQPTNLWNFQTNQILTLREGNPISLTNSFQKDNTRIFDIYGDYKKSFGNHNIGVLVGYNQHYYIQRTFAGTRQGLLSWDTPVLNAASGTITSITGNNNDYAMRSVFSRLTYNYKDRYLFESNLRYDGSSRFAPDKRWGLFPSFSAGWIISEESFWTPFKSVVGLMKLRASWGQLGNNGIGNYEWQNFYSSAQAVFNETATAGLAYNAFGNPEITWETTDVLNLGADVNLFNNLTLNVNYYNKLTHNILSTLPIPAVNGGITAPRVNSAKVKNSGVEIDLRYRKDIGKLGLSLEGNFSFNKNKIVSYRGDFIESRGIAYAWTEGKPVNVYWVREVDHIVQDQKEIDDLIAQGYTFNPSTPGPGDFLYKNANGDKAIDNDDRVLKGNPIPLVNYGANLGLDYAGFDFSLLVNGVAGWDKYLYSGTYNLSHLATGVLWPEEYMDMWTETNRDTNIPKIYTNNAKNNQLSDFFLRSAAYFRIKSIQLGYTIPAAITTKIGLERVRVFGNMENYFTFTKWPTLDPETERTTDDDVTYPLCKTISFGVSVKF